MNYKLGRGEGRGGSLILIFLLCQILPSHSGKHSDLRVLDELLTNYDRRALPTNDNDEATKVTLELFIRSFGFKDPSSMDFAVDLYLRQTWRDDRLQHDNISHSLDLNDPRFVRAIWKPEVYFPNAKEAAFEVVTVPNVLIRIKPKGNILYMLRLKLVFTCSMELSKYPLDSQVCSIEVASFSKTIKELQLQWESVTPVSIYKGLRMPQFEITNNIATNCKESFQLGNYSCLVVEFYMRRSIGYHLVQSYVPTTLFVVISWLSFWMDVDALLPRVSLGITTLLTVSSKSSALQGGVPEVSYVKAIDVWMGTCTAFVFVSLLELTIVNCLWRKQKLANILRGSQIRSSTTTSFITTTGISKSADEPLNVQTVLENCPEKCPGSCSYQKSSPSKRIGPIRALPEGNSGSLARQIDTWCRVLFPLTFSIFVSFYWHYYYMN